MAEFLGVVFGGGSLAISTVQLVRQSSESAPVDTLWLSIQHGWQEVTTRLTNEMRSGEENKSIWILTRWCYDAEDFLEKMQLECQATNVVKLTRRVQRWLSKNGDGDKIFNKSKDLKEMLGLSQQSAKAGHQSKTEPGRTLFGRDDDVKQITDKIFSPAKLDNNGFSIVGVFGVGKSSLAQTIYNKSKNYSNVCQLWVHLPDGKYDWEIVERKLSTSTSNGPKELLLIVIDNLQFVKDGQWEEFRNYMNGHKVKDIRIIITTRNPKIPTLTDTTLHKLEALQDQYCGDIIREHANPNSQDVSDRRFQRAVKSLQQKCEGLPLVAKCYGPVIGRYMKEENWNNISKAKTTTPSEVRKDIVSTLMSSIDKDLLPGFWRSVGYLSLFPRHHQFDVEDFVHLLIGECFILFPFERGPGPPSSLKEVTENAVNVLQRNGIIAQSPKEKKSEMLDLISHVASAASAEIYLRLDQDHELSSEDLKRNPPRHLSIKYKHEVLNELKKLRKLRTFLSLHDKDNMGKLEGNLPKLHKVLLSVRVLSLKGTDVEDLPSSIGQLKHLRYLNISFTCVKKLPKDICSLHALQFLKLEGIVLSCFPHEFHKLTNLLYVDWKEDLLRNTPAIRYIGKLDRLENLPLFKVGWKEGYLISELKKMNHLQGSLHIQDLDEHVKNTDAKDANLQEKHDLTTIVLQWRQNSSDSAHCETILEALKFHKYMKEFQLKNYGGEKLPGWISETFLQKIQLVSCRYCSFFSTLGKLGLLKILVLEDMDSIENISCRSPDDTLTDGQFPSLKRLELHNMSQLTSLTGVQPSDMLWLQDVKIVNCGEMVSVSFLDHIKAFKSLTIETSPKLSDLFRNNEKRDHIPHIEIDGDELPFHNANSPTQTSINSSNTCMCSSTIRSCSINQANHEIERFGQLQKFP